ncbi:MAG: hypothetical protein IPH69_15500 [Bacteroidales bacterium]|nr:hypothetical protein [Bacteroidales bacterium]
MHKITIEHPLGKVKILDRLFSLNSDTYSVGGSSHTVSPYTYTAGLDTEPQRGIYSLQLTGRVLRLHQQEHQECRPAGSTLSSSKDYIEGKFYKDAFTESAVKAAAKYTLILKSGK